MIVCAAGGAGGGGGGQTTGACVVVVGGASVVHAGQSGHGCVNKFGKYPKKGPRPFWAARKKLRTTKINNQQNYSQNNLKMLLISSSEIIAMNGIVNILNSPMAGLIGELV